MEAVILDQLYISSWYHIVRENVLEKDGITHILSVMKDIDNSERLRPYKRMIIPVNDDADEALIDYFDSAIQWIDDALADGGRVMIHW